MKPTELIHIMNIAEKLKDATRHCYTSGGRHESVAEHSFRMTLMAYFMTDEFPQADMNKVIKMCMIHDLGECFTGDIPTFLKTKADEEKEEELLYAWVNSLPNDYKTEMLALYEEMSARKTLEAKIYKAIDGLEALIQHNESDISTWAPNEYELNMVHANDKVTFSEYMTELRQAVREDSIKKMQENI